MTDDTPPAPDADDAADPQHPRTETARLGKVDRAFFERHIAGRLGAERADVRLGPAHGVDFGVVEAGDVPVVAATDPISVLTGLGPERAGRFAIRFALADVAVSGVQPTHLLASFALPTDFPDASFAAFWRGVTDVCRAENVAVVGGHTARYPGASLPWIGAATVLGVGSQTDRVIRPDGARPGDRVIVTEGPGIETAAVFSSLFTEAFDSLEPETIHAAQALLDRTGVTRTTRLVTEAADGSTADTTHEPTAAEADDTRTGTVDDARTETANDTQTDTADDARTDTVDDTQTDTADDGITAMHDATEGGLRGALCETAAASGVRFEIDRSAVPTQSAAIAVCEALEIDPWATTTAGTLIVTAAPRVADRVVAALRAADVPAAVVGRVTDGDGVWIDGQRVEPPAEDASWAAYARLSGVE